MVLLSLRSSGTVSPMVGLVRTARNEGRPPPISIERRSRPGRAWGASITRTSRRATAASTRLRALNPTFSWFRCE